MANSNEALQPISVAKEAAPITPGSAPLSANHAPAVPAAPTATSEAQVFTSPTDGMPTAGEIILEFRNVTKSFSDKKGKKSFDVLKQLNFTVRSKEFVVLIGPSGCGKSTVLKLISGLVKPDNGEVRIHAKVKSATVPQAYTCFPWLTAKQNIAFGLALQGKGKQEQEEIARRYLEKVGLQDYANFYPKQLSGGMQQRVAIARTLAVKPSILLMDEPFGALDVQTREGMQKMLLKLWREEGNTVLFVTHDIEEAVLLGERILVFGPHPQGLLDDDLRPNEETRNEFKEAKTRLRALIQNNK